MGGNSSSKSSSSNKYGTTTTKNPYVTSITNNGGTTTTLQDGTAIKSIYDFTNNNIDRLLHEYLNPTLDSVTNKAKINAFTNTLNEQTNKSLENNIIAPLAQRNMIRSSQATDLYNNLQNQNNKAISDYTNSLLASSQNDTGNVINNLLNYALQGWNVINGNQAQSLNTSAGNATTSTSGKGSSYGM